MPRWMLCCPQCKNQFPHCDVTFEPSAFARLGDKPKFPEGGLSLECPYCKETSVYERHQLTYAAN